MRIYSLVVLRVFDRLKIRLFSIGLSILVFLPTTGCLLLSKQDLAPPLESRSAIRQETFSARSNEEEPSLDSTSKNDMPFRARVAQEPMPAMVSVLSGKAEDASTDGDWEKAQAALERAVKVSPKDYMLWQRLAYSHYRQGNGELALSSAQRALNLAEEVEGDIRSVWELIGDIEAARGNREKAVFAKRRAEENK